MSNLCKIITKGGGGAPCGGVIAYAGLDDEKRGVYVCLRCYHPYLRQRNPDNAVEGGQK